MTNVNNLVMSSVSLFEGKQSMAGGGGYRASQTWTRLSEEFGARVFHGNRA